MAATEGPEHSLCYVNSAFCAIHGKNAHDLLGHTVNAVIPRFVTAGILELLNRVYQGGEAGTIYEELCPGSSHKVAGRFYTVWAAPESADHARGLLILVNDVAWPSSERNILQAGDEMREINEKLLISSVKQHELTEMISEAEQRLREYAVILERQNAQLEQANTALLELATTDGLTGLKNARAFQDTLREEMERSLRYKTPLSLILLDVDHFKRFNDSFGHPEGDLVLVEVARILQHCARSCDCVARYGGEEFALILPQTDIQGAVHVADRIRAMLDSTIWRKRSITASFGIATVNSDILKTENLIACADEALYRAKAEGRDCICTHSPARQTYEPTSQVLESEL